MKEFIKVHGNCIQGVLHGFDRVVFRGTLRSVSYADGLGKYLNRYGLLLKAFDDWAQRCTRRLDRSIEALARKAGRPVLYLNSAGINKEQRAQTLAQEDGITRGLVCVLTCVELRDDRVRFIAATRDDDLERLRLIPGRRPLSAEHWRRVR